MFNILHHHVQGNDETTGSDRKPRLRFSQCPAGSAMSRRNMEVNNEESSSDRVELTVGVKRSKKSRMPPELSLCFCENGEACVHHHHHRSDDEHEDDSDNNYGPGTVYAKVEASQRDVQRGKDKGTAAAQTQMPSTKPKARTPVACRRLIDGNEAASLRDQSHQPLVTFEGAVTSASSGASSVRASINVKAPGSASQQDEAQKMNRTLCNDTREENKVQYSKELLLQMEERKQQLGQERSQKLVDERKHNEAIHSFWGMPGNGAPNYHLGTSKRTKSLSAAGILPQDQIRDKWTQDPPQPSVK
ncbi:uncharacterized protein LOC104933962 isoform X2 [Larimichthys crocea]|uniref:uncharacterized protein LOC104933962 isoform X2 n=1 Tax=Larimichthys crocea TaxID=215358 RepID=UPI000F5FE259|nr:uncharacterized protein LOC104933962 isoform X2 [Larimichthys crocea]